MELLKIKGNTYYIPGPTNIGIYQYKNKNCLLIDSTINNSSAKKVDILLTENNLHPKYIINTHSHLDHCGGNLYFQQNYTGCQVFASVMEKLYMENPDLFSTLLYSAQNNFKELDRLNKSLVVNFDISIGTTKINDEKFQIIDTSGHAPGHIGVITPEKVCFLGDCIFSEEILKKYKLPYFSNLHKSINTLNSLKLLDADFFVISHNDKIIEKDELLRLIDLNLSVIQDFESQVLTLLDQPHTKESLLESILILNDIQPSFSEFHLNSVVISAYISFLEHHGFINYSLENGKLYYFKASDKK